MKFFNKTHTTIAQASNTIFQTLLITYLALLLIEQIWSGIISFYLNLNYLLAIVILAGIGCAWFKQPLPEKQNPPRKSDYVFIAVLSIGATSIIKYKTASLGILSWIIAAIAGILVFTLSMLILGENENEK